MNTALVAAPRMASFRSLRAWLQRLLPVPAVRTDCALRSLDTAATVWVTRPLGRTVECLTGTLWLTFDGEP